MAATVKTNAAAITRVLKKAGYSKSVESATMIRGYHHISEGFITRDARNAVIIKWEKGSDANFPRKWQEADDRKGQALMAMWEVLTQAGYQVIMNNNHNLELIKPASCDCGCGQAL